MALSVSQSFFEELPKVRLLKIWESADDLRSNFGRICKQSLVFFKKRIWLVRGLNPGPLACEASVLTIQLLPLLIEIMKTWKVILILVVLKFFHFCSFLFCQLPPRLNHGTL